MGNQASKEIVTASAGCVITGSDSTSQHITCPVMTTYTCNKSNILCNGNPCNTENLIDTSQIKCHIRIKNSHNPIR